MDFRARKPPLPANTTCREGTALGQLDDLGWQHVQVGCQSADVKVVFGHGSCWELESKAFLWVAAPRMSQHCQRFSAGESELLVLARFVGSQESSLDVPYCRFNHHCGPVRLSVECVSKTLAAGVVGPLSPFPHGLGRWLVQLGGICRFDQSRASEVESQPSIGRRRAGLVSFADELAEELLDARAFIVARLTSRAAATYIAGFPTTKPFVLNDLPT